MRTAPPKIPEDLIPEWIPKLTVEGDVKERLPEELIPRFKTRQVYMARRKARSVLWHMREMEWQEALGFLSRQEVWERLFQTQPSEAEKVELYNRVQGLWQGPLPPSRQASLEETTPRGQAQPLLSERL